MKYGISRAVLDQILAHAAENPAVEVCGLLLGEGRTILSALPAANVAATPASRFELDPVALLAVHKAQRGGGPEMLGHYHSHPNGVACPSPRDAEAAISGTLWMIVARHEAHLYESVDIGPVAGRFRACGLEIGPGRVAQASLPRHKGRDS